MGEYPIIAVPKAVYEIAGKKYYIIEIRIKYGDYEIPVAELKDLTEDNFLVYEPERFRISMYGPAFRVDFMSELSVEEVIQMAIESASKAIAEEKSIKVPMPQIQLTSPLQETKEKEQTEKEKTQEEETKIPIIGKLLSIFKKPKK